MKVLIVGLGSMGRRRLRCLKSLGVEDVWGVDPRMDRRNQLLDLGLRGAFASLSEATVFSEDIDAIFICTPPDVHEEVMLFCLEISKPCFVEASVVNNCLEDLNKRFTLENLICAPSCTMLFHPAIKAIKKYIKTREIGKINSLNYVSGQYLPDWHPYEAVSDYYVSKKDTGGAREIVPFELTWIVDIFGYPTRVMGHVAKQIEIEGAEEIDDTYLAVLDFGPTLLTLDVDVTFRDATRMLLINGESGTIKWDWNSPTIEIYNAGTRSYKTVKLDYRPGHEGYNVNITEDMYIAEVESFLQALNGKKSFPNTLTKDIRILHLLNTLEASSGMGWFAV